MYVGKKKRFRAETFNDLASEKTDGFQIDKGSRRMAAFINGLQEVSAHQQHAISLHVITG